MCIRDRFDDDLGKQRENLSDKSINKYKKSFTKILNDSNNEIFIMILNDQIIGMMQLTFIPGLSMQGITRCQIESVRIKKEYRGKGYGSKLINKGIEIAKINKCGLIQLTSNKKRQKAINFYKKLGFLSLSLIHISEPTRLGMISYAVFCLKKTNYMSRQGLGLTEITFPMHKQYTMMI